MNIFQNRKQPPKTLTFNFKASVKQVVQGGGGGEATRSGTEKRCCKAVNPRASQRSSKAAICFLMVSTLALSVG